jgi:hypothetical protein
MKQIKVYVAIAGFIAAALIAPVNAVLGIAFLLVFCALLATPKAQCNDVTLSVPEIIVDVMDAFKLETPELFQPGGFGTDFSSKTSVLGDKITAKIAHVPLTGAYDAANGGFKAAAQDVTTLIEDVPVTLNQFRVVSIKVSWLTQLASKLPLYKEAIRNYGFALGKYVVDTALAQVTAANLSNQVQVAVANINLDTFDGTLRDQMNAQKISNRGRYCLINTSAASKLGSDDRVRSSLFYGALNGDQGYRRWNNLAGFGFIREYPDMFAGGNLLGVAGDSRAIVVATRRPDFSNVADQLGVPKVMEFFPMSDAESGIEMTGVAWQEPGTGDVYVSAGILFGVGVGKQGGAAGAITDNAGVRIVSQ